ncbi:Hypothetical protein HVR_LOCUS213 [uncultured virus]|nr:Hypothetical protein HVR_LOCUS213 [uncultured virus]
MSSFWNFLFGALLVIIWVVAGGFVTKANVQLSDYKNTDEYLHRAYWFTFWAAFVTWTLVGIFIILVILSVLGVVALFGSGAGEAGVAAEGGVEGAEGGEALESESVKSRSARAQNVIKSPQEQGAFNEGISWITIGFLIFALILVGITGVLAASAASSMIKSPNYNPSISKLNTAYTDCIIAACLCLGAGGLLIIGIIVYFIVGEQRKKKLEAQEKLVQKERALEIQEVQEQKVEQQQALRQEIAQAQQDALVRKVYQQAGVAPPSTV